MYMQRLGISSSLSPRQPRLFERLQMRQRFVALLRGRHLEFDHPYSVQLTTRTRDPMGIHVELIVEYHDRLVKGNLPFPLRNLIPFHWLLHRPLEHKIRDGLDGSILLTVHLKSVPITFF